MITIFMCAKSFLETDYMLMFIKKRENEKATHFKPSKKKGGGTKKKA